LLILNYFEECARKECVERHIPNADTVCVCNATYCDTFPPLIKAKDGFASVYESNKAGARFKETEIVLKSKLNRVIKHQMQQRVKL
jgi:glucosylceramidase